MENNNDSKIKLNSKIQEYTDSFFRKLHKAVKAILYLTNISYAVTREIVLLMKKRDYIKKTVIMRFKEFSSKTYIIFSGTAAVYLIDLKTQKKKIFQHLVPGSSFNFVNSILDHYSLFQIETLTQ